TAYAGDPALANTKTLFTIHNMAFHGLFDAGQLAQFGLPEWLNNTDRGIEFYSAVSALKSGLMFSDAISTVSPRYAQEIQTPEYGAKFDGLLRARRNDLYGILNGVDYDEWSPENDSFIPARYSLSDLNGKRECKRDLLRSFGMSEDLERPLIGCISRLSDQKGFDLIIDIAWQMLDRGVAFILLGSGAEVYEHTFQALHKA